MKRLLISSLLLASVAVAAPAPDGETTITQDERTSLVTITYGIKSEPAIVTLDIQTNGPAGFASIEQTWLTNVTGDVNNKIAIGKNKTIAWQPAASVPVRFHAKNARAVVTLHATNAPPDYIVLDLSGSKNHRFYPNAGQIPFGVTDNRYKTNYLVMRKCHAACRPWPMGSPVAESGRSGNENRRNVALPEDFYIGIYPVTQGQQRKAVDNNSVNTWCSTNFPDANLRPANGVTLGNTRGDSWPADQHVMRQSWYYVQFFRNKVGTTLMLDLPTEAQWEYACRAGEYVTRFTSGSDSFAGMTDYAWCADNASTIQVVGTKLPNAWGIYDMIGNVREMCLDNYRTDYGVSMSDYDEVNYPGPSKGNVDSDHPQRYRVVRGGSYASSTNALRFAARTYVSSSNSAEYRDSTVGWRLCMPAIYNR